MFGIKLLKHNHMLHLNIKRNPINATMSNNGSPIVTMKKKIAIPSDLEVKRRIRFKHTPQICLNTGSSILALNRLEISLDVDISSIWKQESTKV